MKNSIKRTFAVPLLGLSMFMAIPQLAAMDGAQPEVPKKGWLKLEKKDLVWIMPLVLVAIPFYQLIRKTPKSIVPPEDEYSFQEMRESTATLWKYYVSNMFKKLTFRNTDETSVDEVKEAADVLCKNIKNLYNMGVVGQLKRDSLLQLYKGKYVQCCKTTPARGICGHAYDMLGDVEKTFEKIGALYGVYLLYKMLERGEWPFQEPTKIKVAIPGGK